MLTKYRRATKASNTIMKGTLASATTIFPDAGDVLQGVREEYKQSRSEYKGKTRLNAIIR